MGVATSSVTFFRSMGGTFGAAVALAVLFSTLGGNIRDRAVAAGLPEQVIDRFGQATALNDTSVIAQVPAAVRRVILEGFADSMHTVNLVVAALLVPAFVLALFIKEVPLRSAGGLAAATDEATAQDRADVQRARAETETAVL